MGAGCTDHDLLRPLVGNRSRTGVGAAVANKPCIKDWSPWLQACISANIITITIARFLAVIRRSGQCRFSWGIPLGFSVRRLYFGVPVPSSFHGYWVCGRGPLGHRPHRGSRTCSNLTEIKHLEQTAGEQHYRHSRRIGIATGPNPAGGRGIRRAKAGQFFDPPPQRCAQNPRLSHHSLG